MMSKISPCFCLISRYLFGLHGKIRHILCSNTISCLKHMWINFKSCVRIWVSESSGNCNNISVAGNEQRCIRVPQRMKIVVLKSVLFLELVPPVTNCIRMNRRTIGFCKKTIIILPYSAGFFDFFILPRFVLHQKIKSIIINSDGSGAQLCFSTAFYYLTLGVLRCSVP